MLGLPLTPWGQPAKVFGHQTLCDNGAILDHELLRAINARVSAAGRAVCAPYPAAALAPLASKVDTIQVRVKTMALVFMLDWAGVSSMGEYNFGGPESGLQQRQDAAKLVTVVAGVLVA